MAQTRCINIWDIVIAWRGVVSQHLRSLLSVIGLIVLCAFLCRVEYFDVQIQETLMYK